MEPAALAPVSSPAFDPYASKIARRAAEHGWLKWAILLAASFGAILEVIDVSIVNVAVPDMQGNLGATLSEIGWVSTAYTMANIIVIPLSAWLGHRFGKKRYFIFSLTGFTFASVLCGMSVNLTMLLIARALQGLAGGGLLAKAQGILYETFPKKDQGKATAIFGLCVIVGPAIGPALGGYLTDAFNWRWIFFINIPFGILGVWIAYLFFLKDNPADLKKDEDVDWLGIALLSIGLGTLQIVLEQGEQEDWFDSSFIRNSLVISAVALFFFVRHELKTPHPAVDLRVLRHRTLAVGSLYSIVLGIGLYGAMFAVPLFTQHSLNFTAAKTGLILIPGALASAVAMIAVNIGMKRFDPRMLIAFGAIVTVVSMLQLVDINPGTGAGALFWPLVLRGFGSAMIFMPLSIATLGSLPKIDVAAGAGFFSLTRQLGSSVGIAIITTMVQKATATHRAEIVTHIDPYQAAYAERLQSGIASFTASGSDPETAQKQAIAMIDAAVNGQSALLAYVDIFWLMVILFGLTLPLLLFFKKSDPKIAAEAAAEAH
ncbi:MFS transporter, DHA2 family, multidrug resistance protein [Verrucomicrobium sp. GAS474]|uniref:DHA2 family efflux MFS transporter permease subunit n=1 Tax=Verrucomicrobium sp. GAS474 TaxID=1882831 RepID=UPI00087A41D2|nr:DHA2 family efflux MFS transporter permease subunit [Verrucomicrobium sp. GAS474]SDU17101.1 MFS transporter, DHA2 family, multidrug resistance protein [Verrucomicrobium sp. GAS474]